MLLISLVSEPHIRCDLHSEIQLIKSFLCMETFKLLHWADLASFMCRPPAIKWGHLSLPEGRSPKSKKINAIPSPQSQIWKTLHNGDARQHRTRGSSSSRRAFRLDPAWKVVQATSQGCSTNTFVSNQLNNSGILLLPIFKWLNHLVLKAQKSVIKEFPSLSIKIYFFNIWMYKKKLKSCFIQK